MRASTMAPAGMAARGAGTAARTLVVDELLHDGGVIVFRGHADDGSAVRCVAARSAMRAPVPGETWAVEGAWQAHPRYGAQIGVTDATLVRPSGRLFVEAVSRNTKGFPGIGFARARQVWDAHGAAVFDLLDAGDPAPLAPQLGPELAAVLVAGWRGLDHEAQAYRWLTTRGLPPALAARVVAIYGAVPVPPEHAAAAAARGPVVWHLEDDPYRMLAFASWAKTDAAARRAGVAERDPRRLVGAVEAVCAARLRAGHTWASAERLTSEVARLLSAPPAHAGEAVRLAAERGAVVAHAGGYQPPGAWLMERFVDERVARAGAGDDAPEQLRLGPTLTRGDVEQLLDAYDATQPHRLSGEQRAAVWMAVTEPVSLLIGGPGVGKTTVLRAVHHVAGAQGRAVHQAALAGRAAQRMCEATGRPATTIAGLLARLDQGDIALDDEPLVVVDEASMCDLPIVYRLLRRFPPGVRLLLVGDPGQLPPIGFGLVFHVLAAGAVVPRTVLTVPRRQTDASGIPAVCQAIREGTVPCLTLPDWGRREGVSFVDAAPGKVTSAVVDVLAHLGPACAVQIVGSVKDRPGGVAEINRRLQALHAVGRGPQLHGRFFAGDPVLVTKNDYDLGVMNGDLGVALGDAAGGALRCRFDAGEKVLPAELLEEDVDLAYAITCHKAQGSQFPVVVVPVTPSRLLDRTLLLTAVSRAQQQVVLVGDRDAFARGVTLPASSDAREVGLGR